MQKKDDIEKSIKILEEQVASTLANNPENLWMELDMKRREHELKLFFMKLVHGNGTNSLLTESLRWREVEVQNDEKYS